MPETERYSPDPTLTPDQHRVLSLLAEGKSIHAAAEEIGIHRNTVRNWRRAVPAFAREAEFAIREQAVVWHEQSLHMAPRAAAVLQETLDNPGTSPALRVRTALAILKMASNAQPKTLPVEGSFSAEYEAARGQRLARTAQQMLGRKVAAVPDFVPDLRTKMHNPDPIRRPLNPDATRIALAVPVRSSSAVALLMLHRKPAPPRERESSTVARILMGIGPIGTLVAYRFE